jgi:hypothetical protein
LTKLESPYFNYNAEEVKVALNEFMNTLSKHIAVSQKDLQPLVQNAIVDAILMAISPEQYFELEFADEVLYSKELLKEKFKYTKIRPELVENFNTFVTAFKAEKVPGSELKTFATNISLFSSEDNIVSSSAVEEITRLLEFDEKDFVLKSFSPEAIDKPFGEETNTPPTKVVEPVIQKPIAIAKAEPQQLTINDSLKKPAESSISDRFAKTKIEDLKSSIPLNLKFLFINILFDGNSVDYAHALSQIEEASSFGKAEQLLSDQYASKYNWEKHVEEKEEFLKIIERKFY